MRPSRLRINYDKLTEGVKRFNKGELRQIFTEI
jgi:hypothetical protein